MTAKEEKQFGEQLFQSINGHVLIFLSPRTSADKATVTPDRMIYESYEWLRLAQGATDRHCLLLYPAAVSYGDRSLPVVVLSRTIGEYRWQEP